MNLKLIASTFLMIFLAELGDKTQVSIFALAANRRALLSVLIGATGALILSTLIAAALGSAIGRFIPEKVIKIAAGAIFLTFGVLTLCEAFKS
ncbi:MAG: TMEM165/GDT1 family protein [Spirochaetales bacterium]|nr:TMEM165/GDT1 family protein [Spirochaetales bacterium]